MCGWNLCSNSFHFSIINRLIIRLTRISNGNFLGNCENESNHGYQFSGNQFRVWFELNFCFLTKREIIILVGYICNNDVNSQQTFSWKNKKKSNWVLSPISPGWLLFFWQKVTLFRCVALAQIPSFPGVGREIALENKSAPTRILRDYLTFPFNFIVAAAIWISPDCAFKGRLIKFHVTFSYSPNLIFSPFYFQGIDRWIFFGRAFWLKALWNSNTRMMASRIRRHHSRKSRGCGTPFIRIAGRMFSRADHARCKRKKKIKMLLNHLSESISNG